MAINPFKDTESIRDKSSLKKRHFKANDKSFGSERILIVTTPTKPQTAVEGLSFRAQSAVPATRGVTGFRAMLREAGFGQTSRSFIPLDDEDEEATVVFARYYSKLLHENLDDIDNFKLPAVQS